MATTCRQHICPTALQIWRNQSLIYETRETTTKKHKWVIAVFRGLSVFPSAKGVKMKVLLQCVTVIANRRKTNKQAGKKQLCKAWHQDWEFGKWRQQTARFRRWHILWIGLLFWKMIAFVWGQKSQIYSPQQIYPQGAGGRGLTVNRDSIWLITSRRIWILLAHKNTFYSLHMSRSRRVKASICTH